MLRRRRWIARFAGGSPPLPATFPGLVWWFAADRLGLSNGASVTAWADLSGNANNLKQGSAPVAPTFVTGAQNGLPVVRGNLTNQTGLQFDALAMAATKTVTWIFVVNVQVQGVGTHGMLFNMTPVANSPVFIFAERDPGDKFSFQYGLLYTFDTPPNGWQILIVEMDQNNLVVNGYRNKTLVGSGAIGVAPLAYEPTTTLLTSSPPAAGNTFMQDIGETLCYSQVFSAADRNRLVDYLQAKWGF